MLRLSMLVAALAVAGCASTDGPRTARFDAEALSAERDEWSGDRDTIVYIRRHFEATVDTASPASSAESRVAWHLAVTRYGPPAPATLTLLLPKGATHTGTSLHVLGGDLATTMSAQCDLADSAETVDPGQRSYTLKLPPFGDGAIVEVLANFTVPGTLVHDAQFLAQPDGPTHELLFRYELASDALGVLETTGWEGAAPLFTDAGGRRLFGLRLTNLPRRATDRGVSRYVTTTASPRGYKQRFAASWADVGKGYDALVEDAERVREGYRAPFTPTGSADDKLTAAFTWVRDRIQRADALTVPWTARRGLIKPLADNDLTGTDKALALKWLLDTAGVPAKLAVARAASWPAISTERPAPGLFEYVLVYAGGAFLDPACTDCTPGQVRPSLRGGSALILPATQAPKAL